MIQKVLLLVLPLDDKCIIYIPHPKSRGGDGLEGLLFKVLYIQVSYNGTYWGSHCHTLNLFIDFVLKRKISIMQAEP